MHIETLKIFCDLVETKSFSRTAKLNYLTQSAVSQQIKQLEERFEKRLVERGVRTLRPTEYGDTFYRGCREILDHYYQLERQMTLDNDVLTGTVKVSAIYSVGLHELSFFVKRFLKDYPNVNLRLEYNRANRIIDDVCANMTDIGLVAAPARGRRLIAMKPLYSDKLVFICHPDHPLAALPVLRVDDLRTHPMLAFEADIPTRRMVDRELRRFGVKPMVIMEFDNVETLKGAVEVDHGWSFAPLSTVRREIATGTLVCREVEGLSLARPVYLIYRKDKIFPPAAQKFLEELDCMAKNPSEELRQAGMFPLNSDDADEDLLEE